jgi:hypothetical protein
MKRALPVAMLMLLMTSNPSVAFYMIGPGMNYCGTWTTDRRDNQFLANLNLAWVLGFLAGVGSVGTDDPLNGVDSDGVRGWIDNYCQAYPIAKIANAAIAFHHSHPR